MAVQLQRSIYINSSAAVTPNGALNSGWNAAQQVYLVQSANFALNIPRADVNAFGFDGVLDRPQLEAETATIEFNFIPEAKNSGTSAATITADKIDDLIRDSKAQIPTYVLAFADGVGAVKNALMNSWSGEANVGALPTMTVGFTGSTNNAANVQNAANQVLKEPGGGNASTGSSPGSGWTGTLVTPKDINLRAVVSSAAGAVAAKDAVLVDESHEASADPADDNDPAGTDIMESCAQSASFTWDMPVEVVLCLGGDPTTDGLSLGNPPGSASMTVEALSAQLQEDFAVDNTLRTAAYNYGLIIGQYKMFMANGNIDSRTHNLAVGDLYGTYNYVIGGTADGFEALVQGP